MNAPRNLEFAPPDLPLRDDVRRLGALVGRMLAEQQSPAFLEEVERVRTTAIARRQNGEGIDKLAALLDGLPPQHALALIRAFSTYFQVVNIAERVHRIRRRRDYQRKGDARPQPDSLLDALQRLRQAGVDAALQVLEAQGHAQFLEPFIPENAEAFAEIAAFLDARLAR